MDETTGYTPYLLSSPLGLTSSRQAVFGIRLPKVQLPTGQAVALHWPVGATVEHTLDDKTETFNVPDDQNDAVVYLVYHHVPEGLHKWSAVVRGDGLQETTLGPFTWEIELDDLQREHYEQFKTIQVDEAPPATEEETVPEEVTVNEGE